MMEENSKSAEIKKSTTTDSITSSSDTFDTWTLIPPDDTPDKSQICPMECFHSEQVISLEEPPSSGVECLEKDDFNLRSQENEHDGDISDGISIISDSESAGRSSPHLTLHLPTNRFEISKKDESTSDEGTNNNNDVVDHLKEKPGYVPITPPNTPERLDFGPMQQIERSTNTRDLVAETEVQATRRVRIPLILYLAVAVGIIAIIGRIKISLVVKDSPPISDELPPILRRLEHLESRNTFLHNIIDKLIDRINILSTDSTASPEKDTQNMNIKDHDQIFDEELEKIKNFWTNEKQTGHHKNHEKKPYKLPDFCYKKQNDKIIQMKNEELCNSIIQKIAENDFKDKKMRNFDEKKMRTDQSESDPTANLKNHQKPKSDDYVNQKLEKDKINEKVKYPEKCHNKDQHNNNNNHNRKDNNQQDDFNKQNKNEKYIKNDTKSYKDEKRNNWNENGKYEKKFDNGHSNYADSKEYKENKNDNDYKKDSRDHKYKKWDKEQKYEKQQKDTIDNNDKKWNDDDDNNSNESREYKGKKKDEDYKQKSNWNNKYDDHSKEDVQNYKEKKIIDGKRNSKEKKYDYKKQKPDANGGDSVDYDDWQEKRMKYRESARRNAEGKMDDKNWYINRGKARETARDYEKPEGKRRRK